MTILENIPVSLRKDELLQRLHLDPSFGESAELEALIEQALETGRPRACFSLETVEKKGEERVAIGGEVFESRILRVNLEHTQRVGLFVATCGVELQRWAEGFEDFLLRWMAEEICESALRQALRHLESRLDSLLGGDQFSTMNPGALEDWPLSQQAALFRALGDVTGAIGVELTESFLMLPRKSVSGIRFSSSRAFANCQLCPRPNCPGRRMPFEERLFQEKYSGAKQGYLYSEHCPIAGRDVRYK